LGALQQRSVDLRLQPAAPDYLQIERATVWRNRFEQLEHRHPKEHMLVAS
jgi:phage terminase small subunit